MNMQIYTKLLEMLVKTHLSQNLALYLQGNACDEEEDIKNSPNCKYG